MKKCLIIGAAGLLGAGLNQLLQSEFEVIALSRADLDVADFDSCVAALNQYQPDVVINAAAFMNADRCESFPKDSEAVNVEGAVNIAKAIADVCPDAYLIQFSSDFVFSGDKGVPYTEFDETGAKNVYGSHKAMADEKVLSLGLKHFYILRIASIVAWHRDKHNFLKRVLEFSVQRPQLDLISDLTVSTITLELLTKVIVDLLELNAESGLYHCVASGDTSWLDITRLAFELLEVDCKLNQVSHEAFPAKAKRPMYSVLNNEKLEKALGYQLPSWQDDLAAHIKLHKSEYEKVYAV